MDYESANAREGSLGENGSPSPETTPAMVVPAIAAAAATSAIPLQAGPDGVVVLPAGVSLDDISVQGRDIVIHTANGQTYVIHDGAVFVPTLVIDGITVPPLNLAALLVGSEIQPAAGPVQSSGNNFADPVGDIQGAYKIGDLLPYTELAFGAQENREVIPGLVDREPDVLIQDGGPASRNATDSVSEAGLLASRGVNESAGSAAGNGSHSTTGTIFVDSPDGLASVTINGTVLTGAAGQTITTPTGVLTLGTLANGQIPYTYTLADNTSGDNTTDVFTVVVTDTDGDTATATLTVEITDDVPTARNDTDTIAAGTSGPATGNVITDASPGDVGDTDTGADTLGADGARVTFIDNASTPGASVATSGPATLAGLYGTLTISANGDYSYVRSPNTPGGVSDVFTYTLTDGDGDTSAATLTITIGNVAPTITDLTPAGPGGTGGDVVVDEDDLSDGSDPAPKDALTQPGTFTITAPDGVASLVIDGHTVITNGVFTAASWTTPLGNTIAITAYNSATGLVSYTYTLTDNEAHANANGENSLFENLGVTLTDLDGQSASDTLVARIIDDVPTARNDSDSVAAGTFGPEGGNVITGTGTAGGTGGAGADTQGADGAKVAQVASVNVPANSDSTADGSGNFQVAGQYGNLVINEDGTYGYTRNAGTPGGVNDVFTYTLRDADGDTSPANLTIAIGNVAPTITDLTPAGPGGTGGDVVVDEDDLSDGSDPAPKDALTQPGTFTITAPDGVASLVIDGHQVITNGVFTAASWTTPLGNTIAITAYNSATGLVSYTYTLADNEAHANAGGENSLYENLAVALTDLDGQSASDTLVARIVDDVPTARDDSDSVAAGTFGPEGGNVITGAGTAGGTGGAGADTQGADGAKVAQVASVNVPANSDASADGLGNFQVAGQYGNLVINEDGTYSYTRNAGTPGGVNDVFTYTLTDADGDTSPATLTIAIGNVAPTITDLTPAGPNGTGGDVVVDEDDLPNGTDPAPKDALTQPGTFTVTSPDGIASLVIDGHQVITNGVFTPASWTTSGLGNTISITGYNPATGVVSYTYTLLANEAHASANGENSVYDNLAVTLTDLDGQSVGDILVARVIDDIPAAQNDAATQQAQDANVTIDVFANDVRGADGVLASTVTLVPGSQVGAGVLTNNNDGTFTLDPVPGQTGTVTFQYTITDQDGDASQATAVITLLPDSKPVVGTPQNVTVDEDGFAFANVDAARPGEFDSNELLINTGTVVVNFGGDVPAAPLANITLVDTAALDTFLTTVNGPVTFTQPGGPGNPLIGSDSSGEVVRITITGAVTAAPDVTYTYQVQLSKPVLQANAGGENSITLPGISFSGTDSDGSPFSGSFSATIYDDLPANNQAALAPLAVHEDALNNANAVGNNEGGKTATASISAASIASLVSAGADAPVTIGLNAAIDGVATGLFQNGVSIVWDVVSATQVRGLVGNNAGQVAFTLTRNGSNYDFTLLDNIDNNPNGPGDADTDSLSLANVFTATDTDGDTVVVDAGASVNIENDVPVNNATTLAAITVHEDALNNANAVGNNEGGKTTTGQISVASIATLVSPGADAPVTIGLNAAINGVATGLFQNGVSIVWDVVSATQVRGLVNNDPSKVAFTLTRNGSNYDFALLDNVDNNPSGPGDADTDVLSLAGVFTATDTDGDSVIIDAGASVNIENDVPVNNSVTLAAIAVHEDALNNANAVGNNEGAKTTTGSITAASIATLVTPGADAPVTIGLNAAIDGTATGLFQNNVSIVWDYVSATQVQGLAGANVVFTLTYNAGTQSYDFLLLDNIDNNPNGPGDADTDSLSLTGVFTATDTDGDKVIIDAGASVNIENDVPVNNARGSVTVTVHEDALNNSNAVGNPEGGQTTTASFLVTSLTALVDPGADAPVAIGLNAAIDGTATGLFQNGVSIVWDYVNATQVRGLVNNDATKVAFTLTYNPGTLSYDFVLLDNVDHGTLIDDNGDAFATSLSLAGVFTATDTDGDGLIIDAGASVSIENDIPIANDDGVPTPYPVAEGAPLIIDVFANDSAGADGVTLASGIVLVTPPAKGSVVYNGDGTFTYTPTNGLFGPDSFTYKVTDGDGDTDTATVFLDLARDSVPVVGTPQNVTVDEDGFAYANLDGAPLRPGETDNNELLVNTGTVSINFGADVPANPMANITLVDTPALDGVLTTVNGAVTFTQPGGPGNPLIGSDGVNNVVIISITGAVTAAPSVTYTYQVQLLQPVLQANANGENSITLPGITFSGTDSDGSPFTGSFSAIIFDDVPINNAAVLPALAVHEDALGGGNSAGEGAKTATGSISVASIATLVSAGADTPVTIGLNAAIDGVATGLFQGGVSIVWDVVSPTQVRGLVGNNPGQVAFTITRNGANYDFALLDNIDHGLLNVDDGDAFTETLSLANLFTATDTDGDTVVIDAGASVTIENDEPVNNATTLAALVVHEDALNTAGAVGNSAGEGAKTATASLTTAAIATLVSPGADSPVTIGLNAAIDGSATGLTQNGVSVVWDYVSATQLQGLAGANVVFTLTYNAGTQSYDFVLLDNIDNNPLASGDLDTETLSLADVFTATDTDGDSVVIDAGASVTIENDVPVNNTVTLAALAVQEDALNTAGAVGNSTGEGAKTTTGSISVASIATLVSPGADAPVAIGLNAAIDGTATGLTQNAVSIVWDYVDANTVRGMAGGNVVFTLVRNGANYDFTLLDNIDNNPNGPGDADTDTLSLAGVFTATDTDGDAVIVDAGASVTIENDVPINNATTLAALALHEDALNNANAVGNSTGEGAKTATGSISVASIATLVTPGADAPVTIGLNAAIDGTATGLFQGGVSIVWDVVSPTQVRGLVNNDPTKVVFTITRNGANYDVALLDNIDHDNDANLATGTTDAFTTTLDLANLFTATDTDGDAVIIDAGASVTIENDVPVNNATTLAALALHEDALNNANAVGNSAGEGAKTATGSISVASIATLVTPGADAPVTIGLNAAIDGTATGLFQGGVSIIWDVVSPTQVRGLVNNDPTKVVFTITRNGANYDVALLDNIDHDNDANLATGTTDAFTATLDLANLFTATDTDGDAVIINAGASVTIENDVPVNNSVTLAAIAVHEDALNNANAVGNSSGEGAKTATASLTAASIATLVAPGADGPVTIGLAASIDGAATGLFQGGVSIVWDVVSATQVRGLVNNDPSKVAFTLTRNGANYDFVLLDNIDHDNDANLATGTSDAFTTALSLAGVFTATDSDGDSVTIDAGASVSIENDIPILGTVQNQQANNNPAQTPAVGTLHLAPGADGIASMTITANLAGTTSGGHTLKAIMTSSNVLTGYYDANNNNAFDGGDTAIFTVTVNPTAGTSGQYVFDLLQPLDGGIVNTLVGGTTSFGAGPQPYQYVSATNVATDPLALISGWQTTGAFNAANWYNGTNVLPAGLTLADVNGSTAGWGVDNNNFTTGEFMRFDFGAFNDYDGGGPYNPPPPAVALPQISYATFQLIGYGGGDSVQFVIHHTDGTTKNATISGAALASPVTMTADLGKTIAWIDAYVPSSGGGAKIDLEAVGVQSTVVDATIPFTLTLRDGDGDPTATQPFSVHIGDGLTPFVPAPPIVLDLDGDGAEFAALAAGAMFDYDGDGIGSATAWAGKDDGILAIDLNGNGKVDNGGEIVFGGNGLTDLQGLAAQYDSNHDGVLDASDADFTKFGVWQDLNGNGVSEAGEFKSLGEMGITSIRLTSDGTSYSAANGDVTVHGTTTYTKADGSTGTAADASFATDGERQARTAELTSATVAASGVVAAAIVAAADVPEEQAPSAPVADEPATTVNSAPLATAPAAVDNHPAVGALLGSAAEQPAVQPASGDKGDHEDPSVPTSLTTQAAQQAGPAPAPEHHLAANDGPAHASDFGGNDAYVMDALLAANLPAAVGQPAQAAAVTAVAAVQDALSETAATQAVDAVVDHFAGSDAGAVTTPAAPSDPSALQSLLFASIASGADTGPHAFAMPPILEHHDAIIAAAA